MKLKRETTNLSMPPNLEP